MTGDKCTRGHRRIFVPAKRSLNGRVVGFRALAGLAVSVLLGAALLVCASAASAAAAGAFGIGFSLQTTETKVAPASADIPGYGFVNEPYAFTQASGHPDGLTSTVEFSGAEGGMGSVAATHEPKDVVIDFPPGLLADPQAVPRCSPQQATFDPPCPPDTQVGMFVIHASLEGNQLAIVGPIVNLTPAGGQSAVLGLETELGYTPRLLGRVVPTPRGYALSVAANQLALGDTGATPQSVETTLWGVPAAAIHNPQRGLFCITVDANKEWSCNGGGASSSQEPVAFLTMPSGCSTEPLTATVWADSWEEPQRYAQAQATLPGMAYCERTSFKPEITVTPETLLADEPVGMNVSIKAPQIEYAGTVSTPPLRGATVTLPQGLSINPSVGDGLQACEPTGPTGIDIPTGLNAGGDPLEPGEVGLGEQLDSNGESELAPGRCPAALTIGTAQASTPLLEHQIEGRVYLAAPGCGGRGQHACSEQDALDGNLYRLYVELGTNTEHDEGVLIKLEARVQVNPATGQLTVRLSETPQLPLSELSIHLFGGPGALLANPATCGPASTSSELEPWSAPYTPDAEPSSYYDVTGCVNPPALNPGFIAGSVNASAGSFSPFTLSVTRGDREQFLSGIQLHAPAGLSAMLSSVPLCEESQANSGECPEASRIGSSLVAVGSGSQPLRMPGAMYLTGPYEGAPFGLSIITDAVAGPLDLGPVVIRAQINIDPQTAALTITSDPLPQIVLGVPLRIQSVTLNIDRPDFIVNPTNCQAQQITATITGAQGASADPSDRFALADCDSLAFKPELTASTSARTSFADGASLELKLAFPHVARGAEANLAQIKIELPKHLPSRLTTLQSACPDTTFNANPAACPKTSVVGSATAQTPTLSEQLNGPVYFVSHGHAAFPSPVVVLQGGGVRLNLRGSTVIDKAGTASVAFNAIPDVPIDSLELNLPQGPHSVLSANTSLCALSKTVTALRDVTQHEHGRTVHRAVKVRERAPASLPMPTELIAQNGAIVHQTTKVEVVGCAARKAKALDIRR